MPSSVRTFQAGFAKLEYHILDSTGVPAGATGVCATGATGVAAGRYYRVKTANIQVPKPNPQPVTGDNGYGGGFNFPSLAIRSSDFLFAEQNLTADGIFQKTNVQTMGNLTMGLYDVSPFQLNQALFMATSDAQAQESGQVGSGLYTLTYGVGSALPIGRDNFQEQAVASNGITVTWNVLDRYPWGFTYGATENANQATLGVINGWQYPYTLHRWRIASGTTVVNLPVTPAGTTLNTDFFLYRRAANGTVTQYITGVTVSAVAKTVTIPDPAATVDILAYYPTLTL